METSTCIILKKGSFSKIGFENLQDNIEILRKGRLEIFK